MQTLLQLSPWIIFFLGFYLILFIPENKRKKKYKSMIGNLKVNDEVLTKGGIMGKIINVQEDFIIVQTGPDKMRIKLSKNGISAVLTEKAEEKKDTKEAK